MSNLDQQLLEKLDRLLDTLEGSSKMARGTNETRYSRGGNSNGIGYNKSAVADTSEKLQKSMEKTAKVSDAVVDSLKRLTKFNYIFGESIKDSVTRINDSHKKHTEATKRITKSVVEMADAFGLGSKKLNVQMQSTVKYTETINRLNKLSMDKLAIEKALIDRAKEEKLLRRLTAARQKEERDAVEARIEGLNELINTQGRVNDEMDALTYDLKGMSGRIIENSVAFEHLSDGTKDVIKSNTFMKLSVGEQTKVMEELNKASNDFLATFAELNRDAIKNNELQKKKMDSFLSAMATTGKAMGGVVSSGIENYRLQRQNNVRESNYISAGKMGMSDGDLSKLLGANADIIRGATGQANIGAITTNGTMKSAHSIIEQEYGESGAEGGARYMQTLGALQNAGISTRNAATVNSHISRMGLSAERVGMSKGGMADFMADLASSGNLAAMNSQYRGLSPEAQQKAMVSEVELRLKNNKLLGMNNDQMKEQIAAQRSKQMGGLDEHIRGLIGAKMFASKRKQQGSVLSAEDQNIMLRHSQGDLSPEVQARFNALVRESQLADQSAADSALTQYGTTGSYAGIAKGAVWNSLGESMSIPGMSREDRMRAQAEDATARARFGDNYLSAKSSPQFDNTKGDYNSSLLLFDDAMSAGKTYYDGLLKNPLTAIMASTALTAFNTGLLVLRGGIGPGGGGIAAARGAAGRAATGAAAAARVAGGAVSAPGRAAIGGLTGRAAGGLAGGAASLGAGLVAAGVEWGGDEWKANARAAGSDDNDTIFDGDTGGAMLSTLGSAGQGALTGAMIGSVIPVVGTAVGAVVGGVVGAGMGLWDNKDTIQRNYDTVFGDEKKSSPEARLAQARATEMQKAREALGDDYLRLHPEVEKAIMETGKASSTTAAAAVENVKTRREQYSASKLRADLAASTQAQRESQQMTLDYYNGGAVHD